MDKLTHAQIISEFEIATQYISGEIVPIDINLLKRIATMPPEKDEYFLEVCMGLMQMLTEEVKLKSISQQKEINTLSEEEKYYLSSIYE
jgi:hypothetical protein